MAENNKCGHKICNCPISGDETYCSDHCREADEQGMAEIECDCGCPGCK